MCLLCVSCGSSAADEARSLIESGDLTEAVAKAGEVSDQTEKQAILKEIVVEAMDVQEVLDSATTASENTAELVETFSASMKSQLLSFYFSDEAETTASLEVDTSDPHYKEAIARGYAIGDTLSSYEKVITSDIQNELDEETEAADKKYRDIRA